MMGNVLPCYRPRFSRQAKARTITAEKRYKQVLVQQVNLLVVGNSTQHNFKMYFNTEGYNYESK
jgi:hypothetical protein